MTSNNNHQEYLQPPSYSTINNNNGEDNSYSILTTSDIELPPTTSDASVQTISPPDVIKPSSPSINLSAVIERTRALFTEHFILIALSIAVIIAFLAPDIGYQASQEKLGYQAYGLIEFMNNVLVFLISGLTLKVEEMKEIWNSKWLVVYGLVTINFITTLISFITKEITFKTEEYAIGLSIFVTVPTTLGVGVALTLASKGDVIMSLFLTVASNMLGIITVPFLLRLYFSNSSNVVIEPTTLAFRLTLTVLIPTITGMLCRRFIPGMVAFTKLHRDFFSMFSMANLMCMVWMSLSKAKKTLMNQDVSEVLALLALNILIHSFYLASNYLITWKLFKVPTKQAISLLIMCSQKSSPVALSVIAIIASGSAQQGLMIIPCIIGQLTQIFMGYVYSRSLAKYVTQQEAEVCRETKLQQVPQSDNDALAEDSALAIDANDDSLVNNIEGSSSHQQLIELNEIHV